jgi:hypothetical protein
MEQFCHNDDMSRSKLYDVPVDYSCTEYVIHSVHTIESHTLDGETEAACDPNSFFISDCISPTCWDDCRSKLPTSS